jgi:two-component system sensor histidine kinase ChiS
MEKEKYRLMVVDDSKFMLKVLSNFLLKSGYNVKSYLNPKDALNEINEFKPQLILSDYMMPGMNGFEFCKIIKGDTQTKDIKFILITSLDEIEAKVQCFEVGADDYIIKPFNNQEVLARVKTHISIKQLQDDLKDALDKIDKELEIVGKIQKSLLPANNPDLENIKFDTYYNTYSKSGGDYFDFIQINDNNIGILIVDVSGHGTSSTVIMTIIKVFFTKIFNKEANPANVLNQLNDEMLKLLKIDKFATIFYGILDKETLELTYSNAAHPFPFIVNRETKTVRSIDWLKGMPVGILPFATGTYENATIQLYKGERIVLYTDGIIEARQDSKNIFGEERFLNTIISTINMPLNEAKEKIIEEVLDFGGNKFDDDITLLMFDIL